jgi:hypothetical protein
LFEVQSALAKDPTSNALKKEMKDLQVYEDVFQRNAARRVRLEALRQSHEALKGPSQKPKRKKTQM